MRSHPGWVLYGVVAFIVMFVGFKGMFHGLQQGLIQVDVEDEDAPEARSAIRWAIWNLFASTVASGLVWPLSVPSILRRLSKFLEDGKLPTISLLTMRHDPFSKIDVDLAGVIFKDLCRWRKSYFEHRLGDPEISVALMNGLAQEGLMALRDWSKEERRRILLHTFGSVIDQEIRKPLEDFQVEESKPS